VVVYPLFARKTLITVPLKWEKLKCHKFKVKSEQVMGKYRRLKRFDGNPIDHSKISAGYAGKQTGNIGGIHSDLRWQDYHDKTPGKVEKIPITQELVDKYINSKGKM
jgi:hypothetical protein